jgi:uncharacterized protein
MSRRPAVPFERAHADTLAARLAEPRRFLQVVAGARQVGKATLVGQVLGRLDVPSVFISADEPTVGDTAWLAAQWGRGRLLAADSSSAGAVLVLDEIQKIQRWSDVVKRLCDEDSRARRPLKVVVLGSAPLLMQQGLTESLTGRFEVAHLPHWSFAEMRAAFGFSLDEYLYFGGYPGAARDHRRWLITRPSTRTLWYVASTQRYRCSPVNARVRNVATAVSGSPQMRETSEFEIPSRAA